MLTDQEPDLKKIFKDRDGDGMTDAVDLQIHLSPSCSHPKILCSVMDLAACLGFETMGMALPFAQTHQKRDSSFQYHLYVGLYDELQKLGLRRRRYDYFLKGKDENDLAGTIRKFATTIISRKAESIKGLVLKKKEDRKEFDLLNPFSIHGFYSSSNEIPLPVNPLYKIILFSDLDLKTAAEAANFAARMGLETLSLGLPLTISLKDKPKEVKHLIYIGKKEDLSMIGFMKSEHPFNSKWKSGIFLLPSTRRAPDVLICGERMGLKGILNFLSQIPMGSRGVEAAVFDAIKKYFSELKGFISRREEKTSVPKEVVREYMIPDEKKEIMKMLKEELGKGSEKMSSIEIQIFVTRPEKVRRKIERQIKKWIRQLEISRGEVKIIALNAYKPGLSWIKEVVLEEIKKLKIDRIEIAFKEFHARGLEEPLRWLQEIYPIDEILSGKLSILKNNIEFKKMSRLKEVYRFRAWKNGRVVYEKSFSPKWIEQPYLAPFQRAGKVHPTAGWVEMKVNGKEIINQRVKTGVERIWEIYQGEILSLIGKEAKKIISQRETIPSLSIFEELRFDVYFNYPMEPLKIDEERISPLEALHEDFYFVTLDFFSNLLKNKGLKNLSLGRIIPMIHPEYQGNGGKFKFKLVHEPKKSQPSRGIGEARISLNGILFNRSKVGIDFSIEIKKRGNLRGLRERLRFFDSLGIRGFRIARISKEESQGGKLRVLAIGKGFKGKRKLSKKIKKLEDIPVDRPMGYQEGVKLIHSFDSLQGVKVIEEGRSFEGRSLYSLENTCPCQNAFVSHTKRIVFKPTFFINCRHHANEISSSNAGFKLSYLLATNTQYRRLLKRANIVLNPMENADGIVLLEEMLRYTPTDKLHAARYNGAGREYYKEYFSPETPFGEARVKPSIWERWLPDICVDNHGFPSHEWDQPFSGYAPFQFRDFWIPRALIFIYLPHLEEKKDSQVRFNAETLGNWLGKNISKNRVIADLNRRYSERYWKYRGRWLQKSSCTPKGVEFLPLQKKFRKTNYSYLHPDITSIDFISEVADEVTWGDRLKICASAHLKTNLAIINLLNNLKLHVKKIWLSNGKNTHFIWVRERPLRLGRIGIEDKMQKAVSSRRKI